MMLGWGGGIGQRIHPIRSFCTVRPFLLRIGRARTPTIDFETCQTRVMSEKSPIGSYVIVVWHRILPWAVTEVVRVLTIEKTRKLKVSSGEHLAAILATSVLATAPTSIDSAGGLDLVFDLTNSIPERRVHPRLGLGHASFADFEVKSLPGKFREFDAALDRFLEAGGTPDGKEFRVLVTSANTVLRNEERDMIRKAKRQLDKKSRPGHSKNVFLVGHLFDCMTVEFFEAPVVMAHLLEPLSDIEGIDSVWVLWGFGHLVVWSAEDQQWVNVIFGGSSDDAAPNHDALFQQFEAEFLKQTNNPKGSPYLFDMTTLDEDDDDADGPANDAI